MNNRRQYTKRAFTLIEMLVSIVVLMVLLVLITQLFNTAVAITTAGNKHMDADSQARQVFDRMAIDFAQMAKRGDVDYYFEKNAVDKNDQMAFYSESTGYYPGTAADNEKGSISLIGYRVRNNKLERLSKALVWNGAGSAMKYLPQTISSVWPNVIRDRTDGDYQVISDQVFRMEIGFLVKDVASGANGAMPFLSDQPYVTPLSATNLNGLQDVMAIVVTLGVLDTRSQKIVDAATLTAAGAGLQDAMLNAPNAEPPAKSWKQTIEAGSLGIPKIAASQVRVYQRYFYLNPVQ